PLLNTKGTPIVTTPQLLAAHARSLEAGQNRLLTDEFLDSLDSDGMHVVHFAMEHENDEGTRGIRTRLLCETRGAAAAVAVCFDCMVGEYVLLVGLADVAPEAAA